MIAAWMVFSIVMGAWCAAISVLLEPVLMQARRPMRWLWASTMLCAVCLPAGIAARALNARAVASAGDPAVSAADSALDVARRAHRTDRMATHNVREIERVDAADANVLQRVEIMPASSPRSSRATSAGSMLGNVWDSASVRDFIRRASAFDRALLLGWLSTSVLIAMVILVFAHSFRRVAGLSSSATSLADRACAARRARANIEIVYTESIGPAAIGILHPRILLPRWVQTLDPTVRKLIVRHEREHLDARDPALLLVASMLIVLLPWYAPLWWMANRLRAAIELDCDARVLRRAPDVQRYADLLLLVGSRGVAVAQPRLAHMARSLHLLTLASPRATLARRIRAMTEPYNHQRRGASVVPVLGALVCATLLALMPAPPAPRPTRPAIAQSAVSPLPAAADSAFFDSRVAFVDPLRIPGSGWHPTLAPAQWYPRLFDAMGPRGKIEVRSASGRRVSVLIYVEHAAGQRVTSGDTLRMTTPFWIVRSPSAVTQHLRSVSGEPITLSAEIATAPALRETVTSSHIVLDPHAVSDTSRGVTWVNPGQSTVCGMRPHWSLRELRTCP